MPKKTDAKKLFVLDTNVLIHDPSAFFRFDEHDIFLPMIVLEELDANKKGLTEVARNVRQATRFIDNLLQDKEHVEITKGVLLPSPGTLPENQGRLLFQTEELSYEFKKILPGNNLPDNGILSVTQALINKNPGRTVVLVSKDINLRIKADILGIPSEDYHNDQVLDTVELLHTGMHPLPANFWDTHNKGLKTWQENTRTLYQFSGPLIKEWYPNDFIFMEADASFDAMVKKIENGVATVEIITDYTSKKNAVWGITARNREQNFALNCLLNPDIDFVSLQGIAGTGKTLLTLAAGLEQTLDKKIFREIIATRVTVPLGEDIGFLPGSEEEKMNPWMGALMDNLEVLNSSQSLSDWEKEATKDILLNRLKIRSLNFMRGRTFQNRFIIIDEAQNLTSKQIKTLITRAGPGSKIVCLGDLAQIDTPYLTGTTSGLTYAIDRFKVWEHSGHMTLKRGERSRLADFAAEAL